MSDLDARISCGLPDHHKMVKLERRCGAEGFKSFICLILWCRRNKPSGDLAGMTDEDIEIAARWNGSPGSFVRAMLEARFLDGTPQSFALHDWEDHNWYSAQENHRTLQATRAVMAREVKNGRRTQADADKIIKRKEKHLNGRSSARSSNDHLPDIRPMIPTPLHSTPNSVTKVTGADAPQTQVFDPLKDMWRRAIVQLGEGARGLVGKMRQKHGDVAVLEAIAALETEHPSDPAPFFVKACAARAVTATDSGKDPLDYLWKMAQKQSAPQP